MFCKRVKKEYPSETFISTPARVMAILQLCLAFTILAWHAGYPFAGELYATKTKLLVYQHVIGIKNTQNAERFEQLPVDRRQQIMHDYEALLKWTDRPFIEKLKKSLAVIFFETPLTENAWILLSILIPILLLKRVEGSVQAVWLLPLAMLFFTLDNRWNGKDIPYSDDAALFPSEEVLVNKYLEQPLSSNILEQHAQLSSGWEIYLIQEWAHESPSVDKNLFQIQKEQGDFSFNLARLNYIKPTLKEGQSKHSYYFLGLSLFWNLSFAMIVWEVLAPYSKSKKTPIPAK
jgi:hypothetical protein